MKELKKEEREHFLSSFDDQFSFSLFFFPQPLFVQVEHLQAICEKTLDGTFTYIRGQYEVWLGFRPRKSSSKCCLKVFPRKFCYISDHLAADPEKKLLDCASKVQINFSRLGKYNLADKLFFIPWKITIKVKIIYKGFLPENIQAPSAGVLEDKIGTGEIVKETNSTILESENQISSAFDLIALEQRNKTPPLQKPRSEVYHNRKKHYQYYDLIAQQWEDLRKKNKK